MAISDSQKWLVGALLLGAASLVYLLSPILMPFVTGTLLAYLADPLVDRLEALKLGRSLAVVSVFLAIFVVLALMFLLLIPLLEQQLTAFMSRLPRFVDWLQTTGLPWLRGQLDLETPKDLSWINSALASNWQQAGGLAANLVSSLSKSGATLAVWLANLLLIPVVTFYMLRDWDVFTGRLRELLPRDYEPSVVRIARESDAVLGAFLRGQFLVMLALGGIYALGLWLAGLELALLIGLAAGLLSFVPYLGFAIGLLGAALAMFLQTQAFGGLLPVVLVFAAGQVAESTLLTPLLVGDRIGLHPVMVIFAVLAGGQLFGFVGVLLALPATAVLAVVVRHAHLRYMQSNLYESKRPNE